MYAHTMTKYWIAYDAYTLYAGFAHSTRHGYSLGTLSLLNVGDSYLPPLFSILQERSRRHLSPFSVYTNINSIPPLPAPTDRREDL